MTVFKAILKILNRIKGMLILYTVMVVSITLMNQSSDNIVNYEEIKPSILISNHDENNEITKAFVEYLQKHAEIKDIDVNDEEKVNDAIFYRDVSFIIYIPENFGEDILNNNDPTIEYKSNGDYYSSYGEMLVDNYIKTVSVYKDYYEGTELKDKVGSVADISAKTEIKSKVDKSKTSEMTRYFNFLNYAFLAGCVYCISMILSSLNEEKVKKRTIISCFNYKKYNRIVLLSNLLVVFGMWIVYMVISIILYKDLMLSKMGAAYMLNSLVFAFCSLCVGFLIGSITNKKNAIGGIINVVALGTSFICGCFVPFEYMPDYVLKIAHVFPTYYFVCNNEAIKTIETYNIETIKPLLVNAGIVIVFSVLFIIITNIISKKKQRIG